jgi:2-keto-4-pentenoate hydratase
MNAEVVQVAQALLQARHDGQAVPVEPYLQALNSAEDAYAVQSLVAAQLGWHSAPVARYWKSGGLARDAIITHAGLPPDGVRHSPANLKDWPLHLHGVEAEVAIRLGCDVSFEMLSTASQADAQGWIADMTVAIEIISNHWDMGYDTPAWLKLADLQSHGALVLGDWQPWRAHDWSNQDCQILVNGETVVRRKGSHPLGSPDWGLRVFAKHIIGQHRVLPAGTVITTGSWNGIYRAQAGDAVQVVFDGLGAVEVQL